MARRLPATTKRDLLLVGLTFSSGAVDAIAFLGLGKVFTAFQTGNLVFLGVGAAGAGGPDLVRVGSSLLAFAAGVFAATLLVRPTKGSGLWPRRVTLTLGAALAAQVAFLALWAATSGRPGSGSGNALAALSGLAMGLQSGAILSLAVTGVFTTAATATVMFLMRDTAERPGDGGSERARLAGVLIALCAGAAAGGLLLTHARTYAPIIPPAVTALVIATASAWPLGAARDHREAAGRGMSAAMSVPPSGGL
jgi:uncharacterized membrane protein YoaK (UPF0700 family)